MNADQEQPQPEPKINAWFEQLLRFWVAFCAAAMLADAAIQSIPGLGESIQGISRMVLLGLAAVTHFAVFASPKVPRRPSLLLIFSTYWIVGGGFPLPLFDFAQAAAVVKGVEIGVGLATLALLFLSSPSAAKLAQRPWTSAWNSLGVMVLSILFCPLLLAAWAIDGAAWGISDYSSGYMRIRPHGLVLEERRYVRGTDEVWLIGMMHIADASFYKQLFPERGDVPPTIILLEGVTDRERKLESGFSMENVAKMFGLSSQNKAAIHLGDNTELEEGGGGAHMPDDHVIRWKNGMSLKRADIDIAEFRPETLTYLGAIGQVFASANLPEMMKRLFDPKSPLANQEYQKLAFEDILDKRNIHLMGEIEAAFGAYDRVIVPWGALHLPEVGEWLEAEGFKETERVERVAVPFRGSNKK